jgi:1-acyl-sn-glycerol-3-phosphate acyltransferase
MMLTPVMVRMKKEYGITPPDEFAEKAHRVAERWGRLNIKASGAKIFVTGLENVPKDRPVVFISNHQSDFDILIFLAYSPVPIGFVAKIELMKVPLLSTWIKLLGSVFLDRSDIRQGAKAILDGIDKIKNGHSMVLFPEGTRSRTGEMLPFKAGGFKLATKPGADIVPVTIDGSCMLMEGNNYIIKPGDVYVTFHPAVKTRGLTSEELTALPRKVEEIIKAGMEKRVKKGYI